MSETEMLSMAIVPFQENIPISSSPSNVKFERPPMPKNKSSCLREITNVVNAVSMKSESDKVKRCKKTCVGSLHITSEAHSSVMERVKELEANLAPDVPRLTKVMTPSNVTGCFCLNLAKKFCTEQLPNQDTMIMLEDESGIEFQTKYLVGKSGLSAGWRGFSISHKLQVGDVVVFQRVTPSKFKVYVVRSNGLTGADCALTITPMDGANLIECKSANVSVPGEPVQKKTMSRNTSGASLSDHSTNDGEDLGSEVLDGIRLAESVIPFKEVTGMENFDVIINGLVLNSEFTKYHLTKYYELCCSQNSYLHEHILECLNFKLVAGIISETINISDAIRACKITTPESDIATWDKTLQACETLGINVGFMRTRLNKLESLAAETKKGSNLLRDREASEVKQLEQKDTTFSLDSEIDSRNEMSERLTAAFQEVASAAW